jgi:hypothetical protein
MSTLCLRAVNGRRIKTAAKKLACAGVAAASLAAAAPAAAETAPFPGFSPLDAYGEELRFSVTRNGDPVGSHEVRFGRDGDALTVETRFQVAINILVFEAYSYDYRSRGVWRDGMLVELDARTDDNGRVRTVDASLTGDGRLSISGDAADSVVEPGIFPTNHWNPNVVVGDRVLNTINGEIADVVIRKTADDIVETAHGPVRATRYDYSGDLETSVWYAEDGRWVRMQFKTEDGSVFDYRCERCRPLIATTGVAGADDDS